MSRFLLRLVISLGLLLTASFAVRPSVSLPPNVIALQAPGFLRVAHAQEEPAGVGIAAVQDEAGIAAYFDRGASINLAQVRGLFRTIEVDNGSYILGSMQATGTVNYNESEDPHVYVSSSGWVMAYYINSDPASKIVDVANYSGGAINTKLEIVLGRVGAAIGVGAGFAPAFYDFRYPNATKLLIATDRAAYQADDSFQVNLPGSFTYYERSWTLASSSCGVLNLNGTRLERVCGWGSPVSRTLTPAQLAPDVSHIFNVAETGCCNSFTTATAVIVYRDVP